VATQACSESVSEAKIADTKKVTGEVRANAIPDQEAAIHKAMHLMKKYKLTKLPENCVVLSIANELVKGRYVIDAREYHGNGCGGDPQVSLRLFSMEIDSKSGKAWTDSGSPTGEYRLLE